MHSFSDMDEEKVKKERDKISEAIHELQRELSRDLTRGYYYGMDQKIRHIQKALSLSLKI